MTASKLCPYPGCSNKIEKKAKLCRKHTQVKTIPPKWEKQIKCSICGKDFIADNPKKLYCSECHYSKCVICGNKFKSVIRNGETARACSKGCAAKLAGKSRIRQILTCQWCGNKFSSINGHLKTKYCSQNCRYASKRKQDTDKKRNSYEYRQWRDSVYERDNYTCQKCGKTGEIQAHHIKAWKDHKELRYDISNGVTLCRTCHENIHGAKLPRVSKKFPPKCANCGCATKGKGKYCRSCGVKLSIKAKLQRESLPRNQNGQFSTVDKEPL